MLILTLHSDSLNHTPDHKERTVKNQTVTYFLRERKEGNLIADSTILRIVDHDTIMVGTNYGCVYIDRRDAARVLREYRRRANDPFIWNGKPVSTYEYEKNVTA